MNYTHSQDTRSGGLQDVGKLGQVMTQCDCEIGGAQSGAVDN